MFLKHEARIIETGAHGKITVHDGNDKNPINRGRPEPVEIGEEIGEADRNPI